MVKPWQRIRSQENGSFRIFSIRTDTCVSPRTGRVHDFYVIDSGDWINIIPITPDQQVVMVKQYRHGSEQITLEIPGGMVDPGDSPEQAASRELLEETGYRGDDWIKIGEVNPNPAIFGHRCHTFLARNVRPVSKPIPDETEDIEAVLVPLTTIPSLIRSGEIDHAMVITAFYWYFFRIQEGRETS